MFCINSARWSPHMITDTAQPFLEKNRVGRETQVSPNIPKEVLKHSIVLVRL
jgi:hypothetical protein